MFGSMRICGDRSAYLVANGCSPGPSTSCPTVSPVIRLGRSGGPGSADAARRPASSCRATTRRNAVRRAVAAGGTRCRRRGGTARPTPASACSATTRPDSGVKPGERHVRRDVGRHRQRVDRDVEAASLELPRAGQPDRSAADHRRLPRLVLGGELRRHQARAPRQRHPGAAVPVVVHQQLVVELVGLEHEAGVAMRAQPDRGADDAVPRGLDRRETDGRALRRWNSVSGCCCTPRRPARSPPCCLW